MAKIIAATARSQRMTERWAGMAEPWQADLFPLSLRERAG
jgi:hypothetical protein